MEVRADVDCRAVEMNVRGKIVWLEAEEALKLAELLSTTALKLAGEIVKLEKNEARTIREEADAYAMKAGTTRAAIMKKLDE